MLLFLYVRRFRSHLNMIELTLRSSGFLTALPPDKKKRAIKLLDGIAALGEATFVRRFRELFQQTFMAPLHILPSPAPDEKLNMFPHNVYVFICYLALYNKKVQVNPG